MYPERWTGHILRRLEHKKLTNPMLTPPTILSRYSHISPEKPGPSLLHEKHRPNPQARTDKARNRRSCHYAGETWSLPYTADGYAWKLALAISPGMG